MMDVIVRIGIAGDHAGFELKNELGKFIGKLGHELVDLGAHQYDASDDYPDFAAALARSVQNGEVERGVLICGSGVGASIAANKIQGVRAGLCHDTYSAHQGVEHDDMNVLVLGARIVGAALAQELVQSFLKARFSREERHQRRLEKVLRLESASR
jgi:ribose 5-phosphate isomerase B